MLLVLMLAVAVMTIAFLEVAQNYRRMILRDREVEMIHRGVQYERAIRRYYRKNNSTYPTSIEQLENSNKVRYLRKRYKDPMSPDGQWKPVHLTDIKLQAGGGLAAAASAPTSTEKPVANAGDLSSAAVAAEAAAAAQSSAFGGTGTNPGSTGNQTAQGTNAADAAAGTGATGEAGATTTGASSGNVTGGNVTGSANPNSGQVLGGGPILGVVSKSKAEGIHSFGDKTKYNEWFFIYDPSQDKGQQLTGPYNPNLTIGTPATNPTANGQTGTQGTQNPNTPSSTTPGAATPGSSTPGTTTP